jgi:hypothetical protein
MLGKSHPEVNVFRKTCWIKDQQGGRDIVGRPNGVWNEGASLLRMRPSDLGQPLVMACRIFQPLQIRGGRFDSGPRLQMPDIAVPAQTQGWSQLGSDPPRSFHWRCNDFAHVR